MNINLVDGLKYASLYCYKWLKERLEGSINVLNEGLKSLSLTTNDYTDGAICNSSTMVSEPISLWVVHYKFWMEE